MNRIHRRDHELTPDRAFDVLSHPYRRFLLSYLASQERRISLDELARRVAAWESGTSLSAVNEADVYCARVALYHTHLPKLVEAGFVTDDSDGVTAVRRTATIDVVDPELDSEFATELRRYRID